MVQFSFRQEIPVDCTVSHQLTEKYCIHNVSGTEVDAVFLELTRPSPVFTFRFVSQFLEFHVRMTRMPVCDRFQRAVKARERNTVRLC